MQPTRRRPRAAPPAQFRAPLLTLLILAALSPASARAHEQAPPPAEYRPLIREAVGEYSEGRYSEARALFLRAQTLYPNARALRGVGMTSFELRRYADSVRALEAALLDEREALNDRQREETEALLARARSFVGRYRLELPVEASLDVFVAGRPVDVGADAELILDIGEHPIVASCVGCATLETVLEVRGGESETLTLEVAIPEPFDEAVARPVDDPASESLPSGSMAATLAFAGAGASAVGMGLSAAWWRGRNDEVSLCEAAGALCHNIGTLEKQRNAAMATTLILAAGTIAFITWGLLDLSRESEEGSVSMRCGVGVGSVECRGSF